MARRKEERLEAAYCGCQTVFEYEERDVFNGEVFCPNCAARVNVEHRHANLTAAKKAHPQATLYAGSLA